MNTQHYIEQLLSKNDIEITTKQETLFSEFSTDSELTEIIRCIQEKQGLIMKKWEILTRIEDIKELNITIPNGTVGIEYSKSLDFDKLGLTDLSRFELMGLQDVGLEFDTESKTINGIPNKSGNITLQFFFNINTETEGTNHHEKKLMLIINPDPKSLWKNIPSKVEDKFWKPEDVSQFEPLGERNIVAVSKRGRSHANVGSFRDDDFAFKHFEETGWSVVAVADGAGSYPFSRKGSELACEAVIDYFDSSESTDFFFNINDKLKAFNQSKDEALLKEIKKLVIQNVYRSTASVHETIKKFAKETSEKYPEEFNISKIKNYLGYFHTTLIFSLFKKFDFGYVFLNFGVGDCPIAIVTNGQTEVKLMNILDVGEFGGGTRFITQPSIFQDPSKMLKRFSFEIVSDFDYLFLMTDGIYDPKFEVEANLEKIEKWQAFLADLNGQNADKTRVELSADNNEIEQQLSEWMDFWSSGNHDDRTLAIVF
jgi:serine/threonine protein phosphatase PrpC